MLVSTALFIGFDAETVYIVLIGKRNDNEVYHQLKRST